MPPWPTKLRISSWGNFGASSATLGATKRGDLPPVSVPVGKAACIRQAGQSPLGAFAGSGVPQLGHNGVVSIPVTTQIHLKGYKPWNRYRQLLYQRPEKMLHFCLNILRMVQCIGDFRPDQF